MFPTMIGTIIIAGIIGYASERTGFTANGIIPSIIICVGGALCFYFVQIMFGVDFRQTGFNAHRQLNWGACDCADTVAKVRMRGGH